MSREEIRVNFENEVAFIVLGSTLSTHDTRDLRKAFDSIEQTRCRQVIIDMTNVIQLDSSGIGVLAIYLRKIKERKGVIKLMFPKEEVKRILKLVNLYNHFEIIE